MGGEVFLRQRNNGVEERYEVAGLWGGGNTLTERSLLATGEATVYNSFDGAGVLGPKTGEQLEILPVLSAALSLSEFIERYGDLGESCRAWLGDELLGIECDEACAGHAQRCGDEGLEHQECLRLCSESPRSTSDCLRRADGCEPSSCRFDPNGIGETESGR